MPFSVHKASSVSRSIESKPTTIPKNSATVSSMINTVSSKQGFARHTKTKFTDSADDDPQVISNVPKVKEQLFLSDDLRKTPPYIRPAPVKGKKKSKRK